ncbi:MAG: threonine synthase [Candidatus Heteroscillospira sp.]|jgi:threonine synthase
MKYFSTRDNSKKVTAARAISMGLAPDGGLFVPETLPKLGHGELETIMKMDYRARAAHIMGKFLEEFTSAELEGFCAAAYGDNYDTPDTAPLRVLDDGTAVLELWHGPTCAFKDMALQMLPHLLTASLKKCGENREVCILVATSGDTGKAALEGFADVPGTKIIVFYPEDGVSDVQKLQMATQTGENVLVSAIVGNFDDAQTGVKRIFGDVEFSDRLDRRGYFLSSANSINWGRLLPQIVYYISAYCDFVAAGKVNMGEKVNFCVPTGNFGNILAGWYASQMGLPVGRFICASNSNNVLTDFISTGVYDKNRPFYCTISPSMDILVSSNLERLLYTCCGSDEEVAGYMSSLNAEGKYTVTPELFERIKADFSAGFCSDEETKTEIADMFAKGYLMDTHTAVAWNVLKKYRARTGDDTPAVVVSTASPYKFCDSVLDALGENTDVPGTELLGRLSEKTGTIAPRPLASLADKTVRFTGCVDKSGMPALVDSFLK